MPDHIRLYIPGPIEVSPSTFEAMSTPMIGHRGKEFQELYGGIQARLQTLFETKQAVFLSTSSAWGIMEGSLRNLVAKKVLCCGNGAFSDKWVDVALRCGKQAEGLMFEWGEAVDPEAVKQKLASGEFDAVTSPLAEIAAVVREFEDVMLIVDTVSSFSAVPTPVDALGIDVMLTGSQKALALPPGLALFTVSDAAFARAETLKDRGYYFDFLEFKKNQEKDMTPSTPCIHTINGLRSKLDDIFAEGIEARYARHERLNGLVADWVTRNGFEFFAPEGFRSKTLTCIENNREIDVPRFNQLLRDNHSITINGGYGKIKGLTFRVSNMGDETEETIGEVLAAMDDSLAKL